MAQANVQIITFSVDRQLFGFDVHQAREVLFLEDITPLPNAAPYMAGLINLRGTMVPVIDIRSRFGLPSIPRSPDTAIIIVEMPKVDGAPRILGILVDQIHGVQECRADELEAPPQFGMGLSGSLISQIARSPRGFIVILAPARLLTEDDLPLEALGEALTQEGEAR